MSRYIWRGYLLVAGLCIVTYLFLPGRVAQNVVYAALNLAAGVAMIAGCRWRRPPRPAPWYLLGFAHLLGAGGDVVYSVYRYLLDAEVFPSPADGLYLGNYALLVLGLVVLTRRGTPGGDRAGSLDAAIIGTGFGIVSWVFVLSPVAADTSLTTIGRVVAVAYPLTDVILVVLLVRMLGSRALSGPAGVMLLVGTGTQLLTDDLYAVMNLFAVYQGGWVDLGWLISFTLSGAAALHPSMHDVTASRPAGQTGLGLGRRALLASATLLAPVAAVTQWLKGDDSSTPVIAGASAIMFLLVLARMTGLVRDVNEHAARLDALARLDSLTGAPNRRTWDADLDRAVARARRIGGQLHVAILDLDHFKQFNDAYGHQAGDLLLKETVAAWRSELRAGDLLARYGGEEFGVLIEGGTRSEAAATIDRLRCATPRDQTVSAGITSWDGEAPADALVEAADRALYRAKQAGRNRVEEAVGPQVAEVA